MIPKTNGTTQRAQAMQDLADQAQAENASGVIADVADQRFLDGVEQALRWASGSGVSTEIGELIARFEQAEAEGNVVTALLPDGTPIQVDLGRRR